MQQPRFEVLPQTYLSRDLVLMDRSGEITDLSGDGPLTRAELDALKGK